MSRPAALGGLLAGIILLGMAAVSTVRDARGARWPSAPGNLDWQSPTCTTHSNEAFREPYERHKLYTTCNSRVSYRYRVGERDYTGTRVTFNDPLLLVLDWNWEDKYLASSHVTVRYDPANPAVSVLEPRTPSRWLLWLLGAALTKGIGRAFLMNGDNSSRSDG